MSRLTIQLLGAPTIAVDGQPIETDTRKATALMAYLAMQPGVHTRDHLATLLWPDLDQTRARAALRRTLSALNRTPASAWLDVTRESLALRQDATVGIDAHRFRTLAAPDAALAQLEDAAACYTGDFLAGFSLRDSPLFDDWQFFAAEELRHTLVDVLDRLSDGLARGGRFDDAIGHMRRRLQLDPLHEAAHRTLMRLYVWNDQRNAALRQYRECVRILDDELGVPPLDETTALHDEIQRNSTLPPPAGAARTPPAEDHASAASRAASVLPLVGREDEVAALTAVLRRAGSALVLVAGEAGIGKTRLLETCLAALPAPRPVILATQCFDGEAELAYTPIVDLLRQGLARPDGGARLAAFPTQWRYEVSRLAPELADPATAPAPATLDNAAAKSRFFEAVTQLFLLLLGDDGGIIAVDNVQWADQASRDLLAFLARRLAGEHIALILTWRNDHAELDAQLRQLVHTVRAKVDVLELTLTRLDEDDVAALVANALGHPAPELAARLFAESEGNPFFVTEYLALVQRAPELGTAAPWEMPGGVRDLLHSRLRAVDETGRQLLTAAAAIGRTFAFDLLRDVSGRSEEESIVALEQLLDQRLIREGDRLVYDFFTTNCARWSMPRSARCAGASCIAAWPMRSWSTRGARARTRTRRPRSSPTIAPRPDRWPKRGRPICARRTMRAASTPTSRPFIICSAR
ncbi:MAG: AAA family ATPase [Caldilineaceae bacterium]|nr:AAA family ATPase [Caldilineaceae bacterium]